MLQDKYKRESKKILFINHSIRDGGPGKSLFYLLKYIDRTKIEPFVLVPKHDIFSEQMRNIDLSENIITDSKFPENIMRSIVHKDDMSDVNSTPYRSSIGLKAISILLNVVGLIVFILSSPLLIRKRGFNLIYCNGTLAKIVGSLIGLLNNRPVIWHVRNIQQKSILKLTMNTLARIPQVKRIICVSEAAAKPFRFLGDKVVVINNGVDTGEFLQNTTEGVLRKEHDISKDVVIVGNTGRVVPRKGYEHLVEIANLVKTKLDEKEGRKVLFVVVGDTPQFFRVNHLQQIKESVNALNLNDMFLFTGYSEDVKKYLIDFDVFIIPSNYPDPFPRSVIEAMAYSLPVLGFKQGGIAEAIEHEATGYLHEPGAMEAMADSIVGLVGDSRLRRKMGKAARKRVEQLYDAKVISLKIQEQIIDVLG